MNSRIELCKKHKKMFDYNCQDCINYIMSGMELINKKYRPLPINEEEEFYLQYAKSKSLQRRNKRGLNENAKQK